MPTPVQFKSKEQLLKRLGSKSVQRTFERFFARRYDDVQELIRDSVGSNTFRAFHHRPRGVEIRPSAVFRELAAEFVSTQMETFNRQKTRDQMHEFVIGHAEWLRREWLQRTREKAGGGYDIGFGRAAKLLNLLLKFMTLRCTLSKAERERLMSILNVPLDSYTLVGIRLLAKDAKIPVSASMGFVKTRNQYVNLQETIASLCGDKFYPAHYEIAAWNASH